MNIKHFSRFLDGIQKEFSSTILLISILKTTKTLPNTSTPHSKIQGQKKFNRGLLECFFVIMSYFHKWTNEQMREKKKTKLKFSIFISSRYVTQVTRLFNPWFKHA